MTKIRKSTLRDMTRIMEIIAQGQEYFRERGINQWQDGYPDESIIASDIAAGNSYIVLHDGKIVATAAISFDGEPTYADIHEGRWRTDGTAYAVVHRIAVASVMKRRGIAAEIVTYAESLCPEHNATSVRIDTHEENMPMQKLLEKCGYDHCGIIFLATGDRRLAYEKIVDRL